MAILHSLLSALYGFVSLTALLVASKSVLELAKFVSTQSLMNGEPNEEWLTSLVADVILLCCFIAQHSLMALTGWKRIMEDIGLRTIERSVYIICTSLVLMIVIENWKCTHSVMLWHIDTEECSTLWFVFTLIHVIGWTLILGSTLLMDAYELIGIKQAYYYAIGLDTPLNMKSSGLRRLYNDMRHPGTVAFTLLLIIHPHMTVSRLLLIVLLSLYCITRFSIDKEDHSYMEQNLARKRDEMRMLMEEKYRHDSMSVRKVWSKSFSVSDDSSADE